MTENEIVTLTLDKAFEIHRKLGPGIYESVYQTILVHELRKTGLCVEEEVPVPLEWDGLRFEVAFRADLIANNKVLFELKSIEN